MARRQSLSETADPGVRPPPESLRVETQARTFTGAADGLLPQALPVTDRILARLPGRAPLWIALWALLAALRPPLVIGADSWFTGQPLDTVAVRQALPYSLVFAYMVVVALAASHSLAKAAHSKELRSRTLLPPAERGERVLTSGAGSTRGPVVVTAAATVVSGVEEAFLHSPLSLLVALPLAVVINLPIMTQFWTFCAILLGFHRLGRKKLALDRFPQDPSLGLSPVGHLGFQSTWMFLALVLPFLVAAVRNPVDLLIGLTLTLAPLALLLVSFVRLHNQMVDLRLERVQWARELYADAFSQVRDSTTATHLEPHAETLRTAEMLVRRAEDIWEWPLSARLLGAIVGITAGVVTSLSARAMLSFLGW